jgi:GR25 family glycosyltransferase involved in LPS biosynthesis
MNIPILIVSYARPEGVARILNLLSKYEGKIYISVDGSKASNSDDLKNEFIKVVDDFLIRFKHKEIDFQIRTQNAGAAVNVINSIDYCFDQEENLIILEDDLIFSQDFLQFANSMLPKIANHENIKMITGTNSFSNQESDQDLFWSTYPIVWGWATTKQKWQDLRKAIFEKKFSRRKHERLSSYYFFRSGKMGSLNGTIDAWDLPLAGTFHSNNWICLIPPKNLVSNIGFDRNATHTLTDNWPLKMPIETLTNEYLDPNNLRSILCLDNEIEKKIYRIKKRHIFSLVKHYLKPSSWKASNKALFIKSNEHRRRNRLSSN